MAAYSSTKSGNWNDSTVWSPSGIPGNGDTATINSGHTISVPDGYGAIVGTSPASGGTTALTINGPLTVGGGTSGSLTVRGPVAHGNVTVTFNAGSSLTFDASLAATPATTTYQWSGAADFSDGGNRFKAAGTSSAHVTISSNASGGNGYFKESASHNDGLWPNCTYTDFTRIGDTTNDAWSMFPSTGTQIITFSHCTFTSCGSVNITHAVPAAGGWSITNNTWASTNAVAHGGDARMSPLVLRGAANPTGTRLVQYCSFDTPPVFIGGDGQTINNNYFADSWNYSSDSSSTAQPWASCDGNLIRSHTTPSSNGIVCGGPVTNSFILQDDRITPATYTGTVSLASNSSPSGLLSVAGTPWTANQYQANNNHAYHVAITSGAGAGQVRSIYANTTSQLSLIYPFDTIPSAGDSFAIYDGVTNPHMLQPFHGDSSVGGVAFSGNIFQSTGADNNGDCYLHMDLSSAAYSIKTSIVLPNAARDNTGTLFTLGGTVTTPTYVFEHNTYFSGAQCAAVSEGGNNAANQVTSMRSNISWCDPARTSIYALAATGANTASSLGPYVVNDTNNGGNMPGTSTQDVITAGMADYNTAYGNKSGFEGKGYNINCSTTPGVHDVDADPQFVDRWRSFWSWAVTQGSSSVGVPAQVADGLSYISANPSLAASSLIPYIRAGLAPKNSALHNAAHDGTDIGAVAYVASAKFRRTRSELGTRIGSRQVAA